MKVLSDGFGHVSDTCPSHDACLFSTSAILVMWSSKVLTLVNSSDLRRTVLSIESAGAPRSAESDAMVCGPDFRASRMRCQSGSLPASSSTAATSTRAICVQSGLEGDLESKSGLPRPEISLAMKQADRADSAIVGCGRQLREPGAARAVVPKRTAEGLVFVRPVAGAIGFRHVRDVDRPAADLPLRTEVAQRLLRVLRLAVAGVAGRVVEKKVEPFGLCQPLQTVNLVDQWPFASDVPDVGHAARTEEVFETKPMLRRVEFPIEERHSEPAFRQPADKVQTEQAFAGAPITKQDRRVMPRKLESVHVMIRVRCRPWHLAEGDGRRTSPLSLDDALTEFFEVAEPIELAIRAGSFPEALGVLLACPRAREVERAHRQHAVVNHASADEAAGHGQLPNQLAAIPSQSIDIELNPAFGIRKPIVPFG